MKSMYTLLLFLVCTGIFAQEELTKKVFPDKGSKDFEIVEYHIEYYDNLNNLLKIETKLYGPIVDKNGYDIQVTYFEKDIPTSFVMLFTPKYQSKTGLAKRTEHVDKDDNIIKIDLLFDDNLSYSATTRDKSYNFIINSIISRFDYFNSLLQDSNPQDNVYVIEAPIFRGITNVQHTGQVRNLTKEELSLMSKWQTAHKLEDLSYLYKDCLLFSDGIDYYWVAIQKAQLEDILNYPKEMLLYYYVGGYGKVPLFASIGFYEPNSLPLFSLTKGVHKNNEKTF